MPGAIGNLFTTIVEFIMSIPGKIAEMVIMIPQLIADFWTWLQGIGDTIIEFLFNLPQNIMKVLSGIFTWITGALGKLIEGIKDVIVRFFTAI